LSLTLKETRRLRASEKRNVEPEGGDVTPVVGQSDSIYYSHRLCGLVVRVPGYRSRGTGFDSQNLLILCIF
jgi:hypothetical protein